MKVRAITSYHDLKFNRIVNAGEELEVTDARANALINAKVAEAVATPTTPEVVTEPAPKKKTKKASK